MKRDRKQYLGDGVYIYEDKDEDRLVIYTSDGVMDTNIIFLEREVVRSLLDYLLESK